MWDWDYIDSYRLSIDTVDAFLVEIFGKEINFDTQVSLFDHGYTIHIGTKFGSPQAAFK
jgi:hypothetical protein